MAITKGGDEFVHTFFKIEDHLISFLEFRGQALVDHFGKGGDHGIVRLIGHVFFLDGGWDMVNADTEESNFLYFLS